MWRLDLKKTANHGIGQLVILTATNAVNEQIGQQEPREQRIGEGPAANLETARFQGPPRLYETGDIAAGERKSRPWLAARTQFNLCRRLSREEPATIARAGLPCPQRHFEPVPFPGQVRHRVVAAADAIQPAMLVHARVV